MLDVLLLHEGAVALKLIVHLLVYSTAIQCQLSVQPRFVSVCPPPPPFPPRLAFSEETTAVRESSVIVQVMRPQLRKLGLLAYCFGAKLDHWAWRDFVNRLLLRSLPQGTGFVKGCPPPPSERATKFAVVQGELDGCDASLERCLPLSFVQ